MQKVVSLPCLSSSPMSGPRGDANLQYMPPSMRLHLNPWQMWSGVAKLREEMPRLVDTFEDATSRAALYLCYTGGLALGLGQSGGSCARDDKKQITRPIKMTEYCYKCA